MDMATKLKILQCYIEPILMYGCETWTINTQMQKKIEAVEIWFLRRMMKISWTERKSNDCVLEEAGYRRSLVAKIKMRQAKFFGHIMRREGIEKLVTTGMMEGKRAAGRQRMKLMDNIRNWTEGGSNVETIRATSDRDRWKGMIAHAWKQGTR